MEQLTYTDALLKLLSEQKAKLSDLEKLLEQQGKLLASSKQTLADYEKTIENWKSQYVISRESVNSLEAELMKLKDLYMQLETEHARASTLWSEYRQKSQAKIDSLYNKARLWRLLAIGEGIACIIVIILGVIL